ncbi:hypothetical protein RND81_07G047300 [Saponaria officinalis]|uniref:Transposase n=1 Tax=Saponaria officinalis TaxID=3572 RepID=A0AAW1JRQ1_SAPOF
MGEKAQVVGVQQPHVLWKKSVTNPDRPSNTNPPLSKTHTTMNSRDIADRKVREFSAKQPNASQKMGVQAQVGGGKPTDTLWKNYTPRLSDRPSITNPLLSKTHTTTNSHDIVARKVREFSAKQPDASQKIGVKAQVGGDKPTDALWKNSTPRLSERPLITNPLLSKTHATRNLLDHAARKAQELSAIQPDASQKIGEQAQVGGFRSPDTLLKNSNSSQVITQTSTSVKTTLSLSRPACRPLPSEIVGTTNNGSNTAEKSSFEPDEEVLNQQDTVQTSLNTFKPRRRSMVRDWPDNVEFDESEEVLTIDGEGNTKKVNDPIQPHDVWFAKGVRYCVKFNEFYQPLKKGGHILVRFIGDVARKERFCRIRETNWHHVNVKYKVDIVKCIRGHFVLPNGDGYDEGILKRVGKSVRQYRHYLKKTFFKPTTKNREEIYQAGPSGVPLDSWIHLVDYWYSEKGKKFSQCGKEARASQNHVHTTGSTSYANIRAEFEEKNKREPTELEVFKQTHKRKDGSYVKDTVTNEFVLDVDTYIETEVATNPTKPKVQIENEAFSKLMYGEDIPKRPLGYGFGVKRGDVFGVHSILRKEVVNSGDSNSLALQNMEKVQNMEKIVASLTKDNEELQSKFNETNLLLSKILEDIRFSKYFWRCIQMKGAILEFTFGSRLVAHFG